MTFEEKPEGNGSLVDENQLDLSAKHQANGKPAASGRAKLPASQEANAKCGLPRKSLSTYTWQEIQRHNQETDQWLVINRKVYVKIVVNMLFGCFPPHLLSTWCVSGIVQGP